MKNTPFTLHQRANYILVSAAILYGIVFIAQFFVTSPYFGAIYWCVQSALIGSVADWFAVSALFRKPLGVSFHTALIPRKKSQLVETIVNLVESHLLTIEQWHNLFTRIKILPKLTGYFISPKGREVLRQLIQKGIHLFIQTKTPEEWTRLGAGQLRQWLVNTKVIPPIKDILVKICRGELGTVQVTNLARYAQTKLYEPEVERWLTGIIEDLLEEKKQTSGWGFLFSLGEAIDIINAKDLAHVVARELDKLLETWKDPHSQLRQDCLREWEHLLGQFNSDSPSGIVLEATFQNWIGQQNLEHILLMYLWPLLEDALVGEEYDENIHIVTTKVEALLQQVWLEYGSEKHLEARLESIFQGLLLDFLPQVHNLVGSIVRSVLDGFSEEKFIAFVEAKVDDDLSWIRINGALVGAIVGSLVWVFLHYIYEPLLAMYL